MLESTVVFVNSMAKECMELGLGREARVRWSLQSPARTE